MRLESQTSVIKLKNRVGLESMDQAASNLTLDENGDIVIMACYWQKAYFKKDSLESNSAAIYLAKIDGKTGDIIWKKTIIRTYYTNDIYINGITFDSINNIYLAFMYKNFRTKVDGLTVNSEVSPVNAIAKFDSSGNFIWVKNITTPWRNSYGETHVFEYDKKSNILAAVQSQGYYNTSSSCKYMDWQYYTQILDVDGNIVRTSNFIGDDLGGIGAGIFNNSSKLLCSGYFRGKLDIDNRHFETAKDNSGCNQNENFKYLYNYKDPKPVLYTNASFNDVFYPLDMAKVGDYIYELGTNAKNKIIIHKLDQSGNLLAIKMLNQTGSDDYYTRFDVSDSFIVIAGRFYNDTANNIQNLLLNTGTWGSILKIRNNNWISAIKMKVLHENQPVIIFPNPCHDDLYLHFNSEKTGFNKLEIFNSNGQKFSEFDVNSELYQHFNLDNLSSGLYFLQLTGEGKKFSAKFIKQ